MPPRWSVRIIAILLIAWSATMVRAQSVAPAPASRLLRLEQWVRAAGLHRPGSADAQAVLVGSWSPTELDGLWLDVEVLTRLTRDPSVADFVVKIPGQRFPTRVVYRDADWRRMRQLACVASGSLASKPCVLVNAAGDMDDELREIATLAARSVAAGDPNFIARRGALLHTDVAVHKLAAGVAMPGERLPPDARILVSDGRQTGVEFNPRQWELARHLLDGVCPPGSRQPNPAKDAMVARWYRATMAWMLLNDSHDNRHTTHALELFPRDADVLFLDGAEHEFYASPVIQAARQTLKLPANAVLDLNDASTELHHAERSFRAALTIRPSFPEAEVRLGHVLIELHREQEAIGHLSAATATADDDLSKYFAAMFLGSAQESIGDYETARAAYQRASDLRPDAQSPRVAMSELARRREARDAAFRQLQTVFALPDGGDDMDPWWQYARLSGRHADEWLQQLAADAVPEER